MLANLKLLTHWYVIQFCSASCCAAFTYISITLLVGGPLPCFFQRRKQREVEEYDYMSQRVLTRRTNLSILFLLHERDGPGLGVARKQTPEKALHSPPPVRVLASNGRCIRRERECVCLWVQTQEDRAFYVRSSGQDRMNDLQSFLWTIGLESSVPSHYFILWLRTFDLRAERPPSDFVFKE